ncbi:DUF3885 domain-containing protein [Sphingobacterium thalpophilum]|uniref:DUF3885 domain-containing protein n=1 Tax=Sphingobacterium thalpophilum TaxID=259 RepID=A0A4U9VP33_9SPHI|nr:DUF3885 domain-containing protein [Sphingobacterium thalpophilum]VTR49076.1 Uncharacterised protein [Sphingobacterium thalpophilum]
MIVNNVDFEIAFTNAFGDLNRVSLSSIHDNRLRFELAGDLEETQSRIREAIERSTDILTYCFKNREVLLRILLWDDNAVELLEKIINGTDHQAERTRDLESECDMLYVKMKKYDEFIGNYIKELIIHHDMAIEPSANMTCYYINFEIPVVINIYDDRGMDVFSANFEFINDLRLNFLKWIL